MRAIAGFSLLLATACGSTPVPETRSASAFVAVGDRGTIVTSPDGQTWALARSPVSTDLAGVAFGDGRWVAVGSGGTVLTSINARTWEAHHLDSGDLHDVHFTGSEFLAVSGDWEHDGLLWRSDDGRTWTSAAGPGSHVLTRIAQNAGAIVVLGWHRSDLMTPALFVRRSSGWDVARFPDALPLADVSYGASTFVGVGSRNILVSSQGDLWTALRTPPERLAALSYAAGRFVAVGEAGGIITSPNGLEWAPVAAVTDADLHGVAHGGRWVAVGAGGTILTSDDGRSWSRRGTFTEAALRAVASSR